MNIEQIFNNEVFQSYLKRLDFSSGITLRTTVPGSKYNVFVAQFDNAIDPLLYAALPLLMRYYEQTIKYIQLNKAPSDVVDTVIDICAYYKYVITELQMIEQRQKEQVIKDKEKEQAQQDQCIKSVGLSTIDEVNDFMARYYKERE